MYVWKNSIRHTLILHRGFQKIARPETDSDGIKQGGLWTLNPIKIEREYSDLFDNVKKGKKFSIFNSFKIIPILTLFKRE